MKYKPMSLEGGIDEYAIMSEFGIDSRVNHKYCNGRKVYFTTKGGYESENTNANKVFSLNQELTVREIYVGRSSSTVEFEGISGRWNTVMFSDTMVGEL